MHDRRAQAPAEMKQFLAQLPDADRRSAQRDEFDVWASQSLAEVRESFDTCDGMPEARFRHAINEIDQTVFHSTDYKVVNDVEHKRSRGTHVKPRHSTRKD